MNLQEQPFKLLVALLEHHGEVVTRVELRERLWGETYVDFEEGLNTAGGREDTTAPVEPERPFA